MSRAKKSLVTSQAKWRSDVASEEIVRGISGHIKQNTVLPQIFAHVNSAFPPFDRDGRRECAWTSYAERAARATSVRAPCRSALRCPQLLLLLWLRGLCRCQLPLRCLRRADRRGRINAASAASVWMATRRRQGPVPNVPCEFCRLHPNPRTASETNGFH